MRESRCCDFSPEWPNSPCGEGICTPNMPEVHHHHGTNRWGELITRHGPAPHSCGFAEGSFACRVRHVQMNTGWAKSAND